MEKTRRSFNQIPQHSSNMSGWFAVCYPPQERKTNEIMRWLACCGLFYRSGWRVGVGRQARRATDGPGRGPGSDEKWMMSTDFLADDSPSFSRSSRCTANYYTEYFMCKRSSTGIKFFNVNRTRMRYYRHRLTYMYIDLYTLYRGE